ncbi:Phage integrase family protein [Sulfitobacter noctilucae]|uniref:tyrosine-type recombinase/integrase n=1 Tax=Sulfitobacter noctilucae TaxID=1342302 RepID=UPI000469FE2E|nr:tyrosine-type recombinase/integrase [Sulfitobacter noctilucae]KIN65538.1 Phage integrase family protein [Sulfitobacter noctilucae]
MSKTKLPYLRSKLRRGRWFHTYRRGEVERTLGVHGLHPTDPKVVAAWAAEHARWQEMPPCTGTPASGTFAWALDIYLSGNKRWPKYAKGTQKSRAAIFARYRKAQGTRPLSTITGETIERALYAKGGHGAVNEYKALMPVFEHLYRKGFIKKNPMLGIRLDKPKIEGFPEAQAEDIAAFQKRWPVGTVQRLIFDLALYTGAARSDLAKLGRKNIGDDLLIYRRQKSTVNARVPLTAELRAVISQTPDISPTFILNARGKSFAAGSLGNLFGDAAKDAGMNARLHGLRKAFCIYWAEQGATTHQIAAMAGHLSLSEVERYTRAADRERMVKLLVGNAKAGTQHFKNGIHKSNSL